MASNSTFKETIDAEEDGQAGLVEEFMKCRGAWSEQEDEENGIIEMVERVQVNQKNTLDKSAKKQVQSIYGAKEDAIHTQESVDEEQTDDDLSGLRHSTLDAQIPANFNQTFQHAVVDEYIQIDNDSHEERN